MSQAETKSKMCHVLLLYDSPSNGQFCDAKTERFKQFEQKGTAPHLSVPHDICCHFNLFPLLFLSLYSCNDVINGTVAVTQLLNMTDAYLYGCSIIPYEELLL